MCLYVCWYVVNDAETHLNSTLKRYERAMLLLLCVFIVSSLEEKKAFARLCLYLTNWSAIRIFNFNVKQFSLFSYLSFKCGVIYLAKFNSHNIFKWLAITHSEENRKIIM